MRLTPWHCPRGWAGGGGALAQAQRIFYFRSGRCILLPVLSLTALDPAAVLTAADPHGHLIGVHPTLVDAVERIALALAVIGQPIVVTAGVRTAAEQAALYAQGRTAPGPIVTEDDGVTKISNHQVKADGFGHAVDCAFLVEGAPSWDPSRPWALYGSLAMKLGLHWRGTSTSPHDLPHVEQP